ncbi:MAG: tetratricopeptide repeat protein, partial [Pseudomonadota bacterium]
MSNTEDDFFTQELKAELERERLKSFFERYGGYMVIAALALVASVAGYQYWSYSKLSSAQEAGALYDQGLLLASKDKHDEAIEKFKAAGAVGETGYLVLSQLQTGASLLEQDKPDEARAAFEAAAKQKGETLFTSYAELQAAALGLETASFTESQNRLNGLISDANPWRYSAREMLGVLQLRAGKLDDARTTFEGLLGDRETPPGMLARVQTLLAQIIAQTA